MQTFSSLDDAFMSRALELARRGQGFVEPNPMVGCVVVQCGVILAEGWHRAFGGPHAEIEALRQLRGKDLSAATLYVTLEPCCHQGKTPPCVNDIIMAHPARVVVGMADPFPQVSGRGMAQMVSAGLRVEMGCLESDVRRLNAPYLHRLATGRPWVLAKWAMTLDGKIATSGGESRWISGPASRTLVHQLRGRIDGIAVGRKTVELDDPQLTPRPAGARMPARIVYTSTAEIPIASKLVQTAKEVRTLVVCDRHKAVDGGERLRSAGCEVLEVEALRSGAGLEDSLRILGGLGMTNLLVEGGGELLGSFFDRQLVNEVHLFLAPMILGGGNAPGPIAGNGVPEILRAVRLTGMEHEQIGEDLYIHGVISAK
jgi:diaminohydroxyphosphoribosylaminopyrimidine deaminase / 5-amino-6-(5-phosphoribosylamino)uracil reductase